MFLRDSSLVSTINKGPMVTKQCLTYGGEQYVIETLTQHARSCPVIAVPLKDLVVEGDSASIDRPVVVKVAGKYHVLQGQPGIRALLQNVAEFAEEERAAALERLVKVVLISKHVLKHALVVREEPVAEMAPAQDYSRPYQQRPRVGEHSPPRREGGYGSQYEPRGNYYQRNR